MPTPSLYTFSKRVIDLTVASTALVLLSPVLLVVAVLIRLRLGRGVLFVQERIGADEQIFRILKFRTMLDVDPERGLVTDADRLTPFGRTLRSTSLDELPGLINVVLGQMSLIGPRPYLAEWKGLYGPELARRHEVRPGITGLAQVNGRNDSSWDDRRRYDLEYVDTCSHRVDLAILLRTVAIVVRRTGITTPGHATFAPFPGSQASKQAA